MRPPDPEPEPHQRPVTTALAESLTGRTGWSRVAVEAGLVVGAGAVTGIGGALAALAVVLLVRRIGPRPVVVIAAGAGLVVVAAVAFIAQAALVSDTLGTVSADAVREALVPHHIAGAGLVLAVLGTFMRHDPPEEIDS